MSLFVTYDAENWEYLLTPAGYAALVVLLVAALVIPNLIGSQKNRKLSVRQLAFCAISITLAIVTSFIKFASLPFGGSITLFSMFFVCFVGYLYGPKIGLMTGVAYGILQLITGPYIYAPLQMLLDYPLAFGALGLSGFFREKKHGLITGCVAGMLGRYLCHVISGYVFFASYAPEGMNPLVYTLLYNMTYIFPEMIATVIVLAIPAIQGAIRQVKQMAAE